MMEGQFTVPRKWNKGKALGSDNTLVEGSGEDREKGGGERVRGSGEGESEKELMNINVCERQEVADDYDIFK